MSRVIVAGGGAAGLIAAGKAAEKAEEVILIEKNDRLGKKLMITGKGRCNLTNSAEIEDMIAMYPTNAKFLYSALYTFTNSDIIELVESMGVKTKVERGGRVFPESDKAADVVRALKKYALKPNVKLVKSAVTGLIIDGGAVKGVKTVGGRYFADRVILCTGGMSYPQTGSTGDGYKFASSAGHTIVSVRPSLIPLVTEEKWVRQVMGLTLKNVEAAVYDKSGKRLFTEFGEMLFTHFGISGPVVLSLSARLRDKTNYSIRIDLKPALSMEQLKKRVIRDFEKYSKKHIINGMDELLPKALIPVVITEAGIDPHKSVCDITKEERESLLKTLKGLPLTVKGMRPISEAIVTSGGIKTNEIDPSTMQSKKVSGLYFAGEIIDVDGYTGGFNLQAAFSTGYLAGMSAAEE